MVLLLPSVESTVLATVNPVGVRLKIRLMF
jgi:hypothetical protein